MDFKIGEKLSAEFSTIINRYTTPKDIQKIAVLNNVTERTLTRLLKQETRTTENTKTALFDLARLAIKNRTLYKKEESKPLFCEAIKLMTKTK